MTRPPFLTAAGLMLLGPAWTIRLAVVPGPFAPEAAALLGAGVTVLGLAAGGGILLGRSRWARRLGAVLATASLGFSAVLPIAAPTFLPAAIAVAVLGLLAGLRTAPDRRRTDAPPPAAVLTAVGLIALPAVTAAAAYGGLLAAHWILAGGAVLAGWGYGRAHPGALWAARIGLIPAAGFAAAVTPLLGALCIGVSAAAVAATAWTRDAARAIAPLVPARIPPPNPFLVGGRDGRRP